MGRALTERVSYHASNISVSITEISIKVIKTRAKEREHPGASVSGSLCVFILPDSITSVMCSPVYSA
jgi:hypothetical protein